MKNFSFKYSGNKKKGLSNVSLKVERGEFIVLTGKSGCGKTTLTRCFNGLIPDFYEGELDGKCIVRDKNISEVETRDFSSDVGSVFQDPRSQFFTLHVKSEIPFTSENIGIPKEQIQKQYVNAVEELNIGNLIDRSVFHLSSGEKQKIAVASAYVASVEMYVLDEPSANLDWEGTEQLKNILKQLKKQGYTIIVSEHKLHYLSELADRVVLLEEGSIKKIYNRTEFTEKSFDWYQEKGLRQMNLKLVNPVESKDKFCVSEKKDKVIQVDQLSFNYKGSPCLWKDVVFSAEEGEVIGILGKNGAGKSSLIRVLMGLESATSGKIIMKGQNITKANRRKQSFYVMQDVDYQFFSGTVLEELLVGFGRTPEIIDKAKNILQKFGLEEFVDSHPSQLSGGQKQRLSIALAFMSERDYIYLDEPTSGLDAASMRTVLDALLILKKEGKILFIITHDYEFAIQIFDSVITIQDDKSVKQVSMDNYEPENLYHYFKKIVEE